MKDNNPLVSIVTPCYNGEKYLDRYFHSIIGQTYRPLQLIIINDGSTDTTENICMGYKTSLEKSGCEMVYLQQKNAGQAAALNRGLKYVSGKYLIWPDADDELTFDSIEVKVKFLMDYPEYDFCVSDVKCVDNHKAEIYRRKVYDSRQEIYSHMIFDEIMMSGSFMLRTSFLDQIILNREIYTGRGGQNPQLLLPAVWFGKLGYVKEVLYIYYVHEDSHSHDLKDSLKTIRQLQNYQDICIETIKRIPDYDAHRIIPDIKRHYARRRFGNAVDTMDAGLIGRYYKELALVDKVTLHDKLVTLKYTNPLLRAVCRVKR